MSPEYMEEEVPDPSELYLLVTNPNIQNDVIASFTKQLALTDLELSVPDS